MSDPEILLEQQFVQTVLRWSELLSRGEPKNANQEFDRIHGLKNKMRKTARSG